SWTPKTLPNENLIWNLTFAPGTPGILYTVDNRGAIWNSSDGAASWQLSGHVPTTIAPLYTTKLTVSPKDPSVLFAGGGNGIWKSGDGGGTWTELLSSYGDLYSSWSIYFDPNAPDTLYAASHTGQQVN